MPRRVMLTASAPPNPLDHRAWAESQFLAAFVRLASHVGEEAAWQIYEKLGKRRRRGRGPAHPERDAELGRLVAALKPMKTAEAAKLIYEAFRPPKGSPPPYGPNPKAIEMKIRRRNWNNI